MFLQPWLRSLTTVDGGAAAAGRLAPWPTGCAASRLPRLRRVRVRSESARLCVRTCGARLDSMRESEVVRVRGAMVD